MTTQTQSQTTISPAASSATFLRRALLADALYEAGAGTIAILAANTLAQQTALFGAEIFIMIGVALWIAAVFLYWVAGSALHPTLVKLVIGVNTLSAVILTLLLIGGWASLTPSARLMFTLVAGDLAILAGLQVVGVRRSA